MANVWAENTRDEAMRSELESLFERAAEDAEAAKEDLEEERAEAKERSPAMSESPRVATVSGTDRKHTQSVDPAIAQSGRPAQARHRPRHVPAHRRDGQAGVRGLNGRNTKSASLLSISGEESAATSCVVAAIHIPRGPTSPYGGRKGTSLHSASMPLAGAVPSYFTQAGTVRRLAPANEVLSVPALAASAAAREGQKVSGWRQTRPGARRGRPGIEDAVAPAEREQSRELKNDAR